MERQFYEQLSDWYIQNKRKPLILRGARQVGKTYGVKAWGAKKFRNVVYLNFERDKSLANLFSDSLDPKVLLTKIMNYLNCEMDLKADLLFFDEIQLCGEALNSLKYFNEDCPELGVIAAGSLLGLVLSMEPFPVGKVQFLDVYPMTFREFLQAQRLDSWLDEVLHGEGLDYLHEKLIEKLKHFLITGGAPEIVELYIQQQPETAAQFMTIRAKQEDLINSYLADMAKHCGKINAMSLERFWRNIPEQLARSGSTTSRFVFKGVLPKKNKYTQMVDVMDWLESAGLIYRVQIVNQGLSPLSAYTKESCFKLYLFDVGLLNALSGLSVAEILSYDFGMFKGYMLENFVLQNLIYLYGKKVYSWVEGTSEVDFLREINGNNTPIEVKAGINLKAKSLKQYVAKYTPSKAFRLSLQKLEMGPQRRSAEGLSKRIRDYPVYLAGERKIWEEEEGV